MATIFEPANTPKPAHLMVLEFPDAMRYLQDLMLQHGLDTDPQFSNAVLQLVVKEVLDYANQWCDTSAQEQAIEELMRVSGNQDFAFDVARHVHDLVSYFMVLHVPGFSLARYAGKYTYDFIGGLNARVRINYWPDGVPKQLRPSE